MQLLLFRHGIAEDHGPDGTDASRRLTREGIEKTTEAARGLAKIADAPGVILTSPKVRAKQTADIVAEAFGERPETLDALAEEDLDAILRALAKRDEERILVVGHEPTFSRLVEFICTGQMRGSVEMKKAGCACVELDLQRNGKAAHGKLQWLATPRILRVIR
jgi:phosphohistidine phosphatase